MQSFFGVDVGNSGLRIAQLNPASQQLDSMHRVNWYHAPLGSPGTASPPGRFLPFDPAWLSEIDHFLMRPGPSTWLLSSVRRDALEVLQARLDENPQTRVHVIAYQDLPLALDLDFPEKVGIDRLLAALAASQFSTARPLIVIQAGSAVTVDLITAGRDVTEATFHGGAIVPGVPMMLRLLGRGADMLPELDADDLTELPELPGRNTEQAMLCGASSALVGGVLHLVDRYRTKYGKHVPVILSGGDGTRIAPYLPPPILDEPDLVLRGLLILALRRGIPPVSKVV